MFIDSDALAQAVENIKNGELVIFPTETVFGIGADAQNDSACKKIYNVKNRPANNPLIIHVSTISSAKEIAKFNNDAELLSSLWPGPLTMVLPKNRFSKLSNVATSNLDSVAIRIPSNEVALSLINSSGPIAAPSANKSGKLSATLYEHVKKIFIDDNILILESKNNNYYGIESTIVDLTSENVKILRHGFITQEIIELKLGKKLITTNQNSKIISPGMFAKHYAPTTKLRINAKNMNHDEVGLNFGLSSLTSNYNLNLSKTSDLIEAAFNLFNYLHKLDLYSIDNKISSIAVAPIPYNSVGVAINDRLNRASAHL